MMKLRKKSKINLKKLKIPYLFFFYFLAMQTLRIKIHCPKKKKDLHDGH